jgi:hypothetical protein
MTADNDDLVGLDAPQLIERLVATNLNITAIKLFRPNFLPPLQEATTINALEHKIIEQGLRIRNEFGLSFWESIFLYVSTHCETAENILKLATRHNRQDLDCTIVSRADCNEATIRQFIAELTPGRTLAVSSRVRSDTEHELRFPMIDFHCSESKANLTTVKAIIKELDLTGVIVMSGGSYHFYGNFLVDERFLLTILGKSLLFAPIVDTRWVAHQLLERACGLRISPGKEYVSCPKVIAQL